MVPIMQLPLLRKCLMLPLLHKKQKELYNALLTFVRTRWSSHGIMA